MAHASGVTLEIEAVKAPLLRGAIELSERGFVTRAASTNQSYLEDILSVGNEIRAALFSLLVDAQTSGGLLIAMAESSLGSFAAAMEEAGAKDDWTEIGRVDAKSDVAIRLL